MTMDLEHWALYTHCYGHHLILAAQDSIKYIKIMEDTLDTTYEITKLIKKSPKCEVIKKKLLWIVLSSYLDLLVFALYVLLDGLFRQRLWHLFLGTTKHYSQLGKLQNKLPRILKWGLRLWVTSQMEKFDFFLWCWIVCPWLTIFHDRFKQPQCLHGRLRKTVQSLQSIRKWWKFWYVLKVPWTQVFWNWCIHSYTSML